jgi:hypothetical protein
MSWTYVFKRTETVGRFDAEDPWNGSRATTFTLHARTGGFMPMHAAAERSVPPRYTMTSEIDGRRRQLPDVLVKLWKEGRVAAERLPWLLHTLEPDLRRLDYLHHLTLSRFQRGFRTWLGPVVGLLIVAATGAVAVAEPAGAWEVCGFGLSAAALIGILPWLFARRLDRRREQQMGWVLGRASA